MTNWNLIFRRTHLFLGMLLIPWMLMYALSTVIFNHSEHFKKYRPADPQWVQLWEKDYKITVPAENEALRQMGQQILDENGLKGPFAVFRQGQRVNVNLINFWKPRRITYEPANGKLRAEEKKFSWVEVFARLHQRTGYGHGGFLSNLWAVLVDVFCVTSLVWIGTGLYLWWKLPMTRKWGFIALGGGFGTILILLLTL